MLMRTNSKKLLNWTLCFFTFASAVWSSSSQAQEFVLGGQVGALGTAGTKDGSEKSAIAFGPFLKINPYGWAAFKIDAAFAHYSGGNYFSSSPAILLYPVAFEEFSLGLITGAGFYKLPHNDIKFGVNIGASGDFAVTKHASVGMETRYHPVFDSPDIWTVFLTLGFRFEGADSW